ncbi:MAG: hypothetical protein HY260_00035 [Chloroflexi bacterium]|nr:hypothetical protein [Chloroflexota bacterium]
MRFLNLFLSIALFAPLTQGESAALTAPAEGQTVFGVVAISGSAASPQFQRYELEFGYEPNPTDTWFPIQEPVLTPQPGGVLGQWNTAGIADGVYLIRLRLYRQDGSFAEAFIHNVLLKNGSPTPAASPGPTSGPGKTPEAAVTATGVLVELPPSSTPRPTATPRGAGSDSGSSAGSDIPGPAFSLPTFGRAFVTGIGWTLAAFVVMGLYSMLRPAIRPRLRRLIRDLLKPK